MNTYQQIWERVNVESIDKKLYNPSFREAYKFAEQYFKRNHLGKKVQTKDGKNISVTEKGFKELFWSISAALRGETAGAARIFSSRNDDDDYMFDTLDTIISLEDILKDMEFEHSEKNYKPEKKPDIKRYDTYECEAELDDEIVNIKIRVEVPHEGQPRYYFHYIN